MPGMSSGSAELTGLRFDPYFTGTKLTWLARNAPEIWAGVRAGSVAIGTVDSYLIARLTGGTRHVTDASNASRTLLFDITAGRWSDELCSLFEVPAGALPEVVPSTGVIGTTDPSAFLGLSVPIAGVAGDQQAALFGQACYAPGSSKCTYGTGSFVLTNTGSRDRAVRSRPALDGRLDGRRRRAHLCARRRGLRHRRRDPVAAGRPRHHPQRGRQRRTRAVGGRFGWRGVRARTDRPGRTGLGSRRPRRDLRPDSRRHQGPPDPGDPGGDRVRGAGRGGADRGRVRGWGRVRGGPGRGPGRAGAGLPGAGAGLRRCGSMAGRRPTTC